MSYPAFPSIKPSTGSTLTKMYKTLQSPFGGSYVQVAPDGINYQVSTWSLVFENLNAADSATLESFFDSVGSFGFWTWTPPSGGGTVWRMDVAGYNKNSQGLVNTYSFNAIQVY